MLIDRFCCNSYIATLAAKKIVHKHKIRLTFSVNVQRICKSSLVKLGKKLVKRVVAGLLNFPWGFNSPRKKDSQKLGQETKPVT